MTYYWKILPFHILFDRWSPGCLSKTCFDPIILPWAKYCLPVCSSPASFHIKLLDKNLPACKFLIPCLTLHSAVLPIRLTMLKPWDPLRARAHQNRGSCKSRALGVAVGPNEAQSLGTLPWVNTALTLYLHHQRPVSFVHAIWDFS